jgi:two-component system response regulator AtoC
MRSTHNGKTILLVEDDLEVRSYLEMALKCEGFSVDCAEDGEGALAIFDKRGADVAAVLMDIIMPCKDGMETLSSIRSMDPLIPIIIISGASTPLNVVEAMKRGATDFVGKPVTHEDLCRVVRNALESRQESGPQNPAPKLVRTSPGTFRPANARVQEIYAMADQVGWSEAPVLILGETGVGKEVLARELHAQSPRASKPFLKLNCAALPSELVESELFGYERGAFTGAFQRKPGMFEMADQGTMFLDEIGDMDFKLQAKLLQVLQDREFQRVGGRETVRVNVRIIAATHRNLERAIDEGDFRADLFYRLNVIMFEMPPLRERVEDIIPLATFLIRKHAITGVAAPVLTPALRRTMLSYPWPGNIRELENVMRRFVILRDADGIAAELNAKMARQATPMVAPSARAPLAPAPILEQVTKAKDRAETEAILAALNATRWNRKKAAATLRIDYKALLYKMKKLGIESSPMSSHYAEIAAGAAGGAGMEMGS